MLEAFLRHERGEQSAHDDLFAAGAKAVGNFKRAGGLRREAVDGDQVRRGVEIKRLSTVVIHEFDFDVRRRERGEDGDAQGRRGGEVAQEIVHQPLVQLRQASEKFFKPGIDECNFHLTGHELRLCRTFRTRRAGITLLFRQNWTRSFSSVAASVADSLPQGFKFVVYVVSVPDMADKTPALHSGGLKMSRFARFVRQTFALLRQQL